MRYDVETITAIGVAWSVIATLLAVIAIATL